MEKYPGLNKSSIFVSEHSLTVLAMTTTKAEMTARQLEIIDAAGRILTSSGVSGLTIKRLAAEMNFSESAIYRHFTGKEEIIIAMLHYLKDTIGERVAQASQEGDTTEAKLRAMFRSMYSFFEDRPHFVVAVFSDGLMEESDRINEAILGIMGTMMGNFLPVVMDGQRKKALTNAIAAEDLLHIVMGSFRLLMFKWRVSEFGFAIERSAENTLEALFTLLIPERP